MNNAISLRFESKLHAPTARVWEWITSVEGISAEMWPFFRMTTPKGIHSLSEVQIEPACACFGVTFSCSVFCPLTIPI
jgi:hypothetical protein